MFHSLWTITEKLYRLCFHYINRYGSNFFPSLQKYRIMFKGQNLSERKKSLQCEIQTHRITGGFICLGAAALMGGPFDTVYFRIVVKPLGNILCPDSKAMRIGLNCSWKPSGRTPKHCSLKLSASVVIQSFSSARLVVSCLGFGSPLP